MKVVRINEPANFRTALADALAAHSGRTFVLFFGTEVPSTGVSWCPDCVIADPLIRKAVRAVPDSLLVEVPAGQRGDEYRNSPYISDPEIQLRAVPTLFEWSKTGPLKKLVEAECADEDLLAKFLA